MKNAERSLDTRIEASPSSPFWKFFNASKTQAMGGPIQKERSDLALYADLARSLEGLSLFTHELRPASESMVQFADLSSVIRQYRANWRQSCASLAITGTNPDKDVVTTGNYSQDALRTYLRSVRDYCASLALGLVLSIIVRMYHPSQEHLLSQISRNFTAEMITLAKQATRFKPLGAAFMSPFMHTIWAAGDHDTRMALTSTLHLHQIDFDVRNAKFLSERMNTLFQNMRARIHAQASSRSIDSAATPISTTESQRDFEASIQHMSWTSCLFAAEAREPPTPTTTIGDCPE